jgi:hypothetical protein
MGAFGIAWWSASRYTSGTLGNGDGIQPMMTSLDDVSGLCPQDPEVDVTVHIRFGIPPEDLEDILMRIRREYELELDKQQWVAGH